MTSFDYIVIGSGSAGSVVAARLSEDPAVSVLLLEAGRRDDHFLMHMPIAFPKILANPAYTWPFETDPEPGLNGRQLPILRGKTLGGTSSINGMVNVRGNRFDYDLLRQRGLEGWGYADVLPYFRKLENSWRGSSLYHGTGGPVGSELPDLPEARYPELEQAVVAAGIPVCSDHHGAEQIGISRIEIATNNGHRASSSRAYLHPAMKTRRNLTVLTGAQTTRILFEGKRAVGVEYLRKGKLEQVRADREIIVSAGAYASPQLLMLSGVGPADHLREVGVDVVHDLPGVGQNLQEHPNILNVYRMKDKIGFARHLRFDRAALAVMRWALFGKGPFATGGSIANIFTRSRPDVERPDVQILLMPVHQNANLWFPSITEAPTYAYTARVGILHAVSRGWVKLRSSNPFDLPRIRFNMFTEQADMIAMINALKLSRHVFDQSPIRELVEEELTPGKHIKDDAALEQMIRSEAQHRHHAVGTCSMGTDSMSVVDAQLRVNGIEGLRVADTSILPEDTSGNTNIPAMMIGEKVADLIKGRRLEPAEV